MRFAGAKLDKDIAARRLLLGYIREAFDLDVQASARAAQLYEQHIVDLIALALGADGEVRAAAEDRGVRSRAAIRDSQRRSRAAAAIRR